MKRYLCHKEVLARPMTRGEYNIYRSWAIPTNENPDTHGYLVEYLDSPNSQMHPDHSNYISWSPASVFENGYSII